MTTTPGGDEPGLPARRDEEQADAPVVRTGMFGVTSTGDTSGYGRLRLGINGSLMRQPRLAEMYLVIYRPGQ